MMKTDNNSVEILISEKQAVIQNARLSIQFDLNTGEYSGIERSDNSFFFRDAWFRVGEGGWKEPDLECRAEPREEVKDDFGTGRKLRVWYKPESKYDPSRFLDVTLYENQSFIVIGWGVQNDKSYTVRVTSAEVLVNGTLFAEQKPTEARVLRGGAGCQENFVELDWQIDATNSAMLTYRDGLNGNRRRTLVAGGLNYREYVRRIETHAVSKGGRRPPGQQKVTPKIGSFLSLTMEDPLGKRIAPGELWESSDTFFLDGVTADPFMSLEQYGNAMAAANNASPNPYDFPTLCGWMTSDDILGDNVPINNSPKLVEQMRIAHETGLTKYTPIGIRLEPDFYCYTDGGDTQQGWYDDEHFAKYGSLQEPYETFKKFTDKIAEYGGKVLTYVQTSMPSNDFALEHPEWMLNNDISMLYEHRRHARTKVLYDFTDPGFQDYMLKVWTRLGNDGVQGVKFDYPARAWNVTGGFEDDSYTTTSAYLKIYELCRAGLGPNAYVHERSFNTDATVGTVDLQRCWADASHFEAEMASRMGLRWYKQGVAFRYYPDGKSFYPGGNPLSEKDRRTFLTLIGLLSGRLELGTGFNRLTDEIRHDITRLFPVLPNGKAFRPVDFLLSKKHPEVYVYAVDNSWAQVIMVNNEEPGRWVAKTRTISTPVAGDQADVGSLGLSVDRCYYVFDFWAQKPLGIIKGDGHLDAELETGEARVYAVREVEDHPQIIGTNRHVMCGMMEITDTHWDPGTSTLSFDLTVVGGEPMIVTLALPSGETFVPETVTAEGLAVSFDHQKDYGVGTVKSDKSRCVRVSLLFKRGANANA